MRTNHHPNLVFKSVGFIYYKSCPVYGLKDGAILHDHLKGSDENIELEELRNDLVFGVTIEKLVLPYHVPRVAVSVIHYGVHVCPCLKFSLPMGNGYISVMYLQLYRLKEGKGEEDIGQGGHNQKRTTQIVYST
jgi:hypothetical protein